MCVFVLIGCNPASKDEKLYRSAAGFEIKSNSLEVELVATQTVLDELDIEKPKNVFGVSDDEILNKLREQEIVSIETGGGGRSVGFKIALKDGTKGYFKPEQHFSGARWYSEIAAFHVDRLLGFGRVAPTTGREIPWKKLKAVLKNHSKKDEIVVQKNGMVRGALMWWIPQELMPLRLGVYWEKWVRIQGPILLTPFQSPADWREDLHFWSEHGRALDAHHLEQSLMGSSIRTRGEAKSPDHPSRPKELSDMIVFDYLISNVDRWSENFTNVRTLGKAGPLLFFDNGAGFWVKSRPPLQDKKIKLLQKFRFETLLGLEKLAARDLRNSLGSDPLAPVLKDFHFKGFQQRVEYLLKLIRSLERRFGDAIFFTNTGSLSESG